MPRVRRVGDLEVTQDLRFQRREWAVQRVGWMVMALLALGALLGLFGDGPLARAAADSQDGRVHVEYDRLARRSAATLLRVAYAGPVRGDSMVVWMDRSYLEANSIEQVVPEPREVVTDGDRVIYVFAVGDGAPPARVTFELSPLAIGGRQGRMGVDDAAVELRQFVFP
jgi:hypothetical protein